MHSFDIPETAGIYAIGLVNRTGSEIEPIAEIDQMEDFNQLFEKKSIFLNGLPTDILYIGRSTNLQGRISQLVRFGNGGSQWW